MRARFLFFVLFAAAAGYATSGAQVVTYTFGSAGSPTTAANAVAANLSASTFAASTGSPGTGSSSPVYSSGSGGSYFTATSWTGGAPGTNYFEFTLTPSNGYQLNVTSLTFGYRSTATGPTAFAFRSSADGYATNLATGALTSDSLWYASGTQSITLSGLTSGTTFRLYGSGASGAGGTWRVDDVSVAGALSAVPEPAAVGVLLGSAALAAAVWIRRRERKRAS